MASNFDNFTQMLDELGHSFSVIGLTGTTLSNAGVEGFINNIQFYSIRSDLSSSSTEYQTLWIEIQSDVNHNLICGAIYKHLQNDFKAFMVNLNQILNKINKENKYCILMGDFNLNLLNCELHTGTDDLIDTMGSYFYPHILQPTRITDQTATLIHNIFF